MIVVDAQVHIWKPETPERPYIKEDASKPHRAIPLTYDNLLQEMTVAGVDRAILVPPSWEGYRNDYALEAAQKYPDRFAVMGKVPLNDPASKDRIASCSKHGPASRSTRRRAGGDRGIRSHQASIVDSQSGAPTCGTSSYHVRCRKKRKTNNGTTRTSPMARRSTSSRPLALLRTDDRWRLRHLYHAGFELRRS